MSANWLNLFFRFSGYTFTLKQKIVLANNWLIAIPYAALLIVSELGFIIVSLPIYILVPPAKVQEEGFIFPKAIKDKPQFQSYIVRRKISLTTFFTAGGIFLFKALFIGIVSLYLLGVQPLLAATQDWTFSTPTDYSYDSSKIEVTSGVAKLKDQGTGGSCSGTATVCNTFVTSPTCAAQAGCTWGGAASGSSPAWSTTWGTYADWEDGARASGSSPTTGGNPTNYKSIALSRVNAAGAASGYWQQSFTTTAANPQTATISFDWSIKSYEGTFLTSYIIYVFVDNFSGAPVIGDEVWSQTISGTTAWATVSNINVASKLTVAGPYYIKLVARRIKTAGNPPNKNNTVGWDNVSLNWSKSNSCSGTATACNTFISSPTCAAQGGCTWNTVPVYPTDWPAIFPVSALAPTGVTGWNSFTEIATKNGGQIYYQLSADDGVTWQYWNGLVWANAATSTDSNIASVINANITSFPVSTGKIKWKAFLAGSSSQQVILDNVAIGYTQNFVPIVQNLSATQNTSSGYVQINYNLQDSNNDPCSLVNYEYSLTGEFNGEQAFMTAASDPAHSGVTGLSSSAGGTAHAFVWDAKTDLGNVYASNVYVRLRASDGIADSGYTTSTALTLDYALPAVSNLTAGQTPGSADVQISYDLFDNTADNILVELQISADGGATWDVLTASVVGDIGVSVTSGNGKTITWHSDVDFSNHEENGMRVKIRAKDKYQNQSEYSSSVNFSLDNKAPIVATQADLLAQPNAGATAVLVGGSFTENNPNTNNFYVAINGGSYGSAGLGDTDTATPSDLSVPLDLTLRGNDYISAVKIEHTDDFGHLTVNENLSPTVSYKYVKPYTPPAPTVGEPAETSLSVTIDKHPEEADGLEYVLFESTQGKYVQGNGTLNDSPYWQPVGTVVVTGLSQPLNQYIFQVKSRNTSDTNYAATSESEFSSSASSDYQSPSITINSAAQTTNGTKYVTINYTGVDYRNQPNNLVKYEYSTNGTDWQIMTEKLGKGGDGVAALAFSNGGASLVFTWDVGADLPGVEDSSVYVRLQSNDSVTNSNIAVSSAFIVNTAGPLISNLQVGQTPLTNSVVITYDLADGAGANNVVVLSVSDNSGATYSVSAPSVSGNVGNGVTAGVGRSITWNVGADLPDEEKNTMKVKIVATDSYGNEGTGVESNEFVIDTKKPVVSDVIAFQSSGSALVTVNYNLSDLSSSAVMFEISSDSGATWDVATTTASGDIGSGITTGAKSFAWNVATDFPNQELSTMQVRIQALDYFGNLGSFSASSDFAINSKVLSIVNITAEQNSLAKTVTINYDLNKAADISLDISADGGITWDVATTTLSGAVGVGVLAGNNRTVTWDAAADFNNEERANMRVRLSGIDSTGTVSPYYESADFSVDTASPLGLLSLNKFANTNDSVTLDWSAGVTDAHFKHYELWHGAVQNDVINRLGTAAKWSVDQDALLSNANAVSTVITGINLTADYFVKIWAVDDYGNETTVADLNVFTAPILVTFPLEIEAPEGSGSVDPAVGTHTYNQGTNVQITATAFASWLFDHWILDGLASGSINPLILSMNATHTLKAVFTESTTPIEPAPVPVSLPIVGGGAPVPPDIIAPSKPILTQPASPTKYTEVLIFGLAEPGSRVDLYDNNVLVKRFNSVANNDGEFSQVFIFTVGEHILTVKAVDFSNNTSESSDPVSLNIITSVPLAPIVLSPQNNSSITTAVPVLVGVSEPFFQVEIVLDNKNKFTVTADSNGSWRFGLPNSFALKDGSHTFTFTATDAAGNISPQINLVLAKITPRPALTVPQTAPASTPTPVLPSSLVRENIEAVELPGIPVPKVAGVSVSAANDVFSFTGTALPNQDVIVYVHSDQALIYRTRTDSNGVWRINHSQSAVELAPGQHTIFAVAVNTNAKVKSQPSAISSFVVKRNVWAMIFKYLNWQTTLATLIVLLLTTFWLYRIRKPVAVKVI